MALPFFFFCAWHWVNNNGEKQSDRKRHLKCLLTEFCRVIVNVRGFGSDVYAALAEVRRDLAQASGVIVGI
jgi:hypothetical protein